MSTQDTRNPATLRRWLDSRRTPILGFVFTGIIQHSLPVMHVARTDDALRLVLPNVWHDVKHGESIAVNGTCLTVADLSGERLAFDVIRETLDRTNLGRLESGHEVHVERSLRVGDRFDGHMVQGHIDGTANILATPTADNHWRLTIRTPAEMARYLVPKGSITLDGVSLTLATIDEQSFQVALIPTTLSITRLSQRPIGWPLNVECDMMVKTIVRTVESLQLRVERNDPLPSQLPTTNYQRQ